MDPLKMLRNVDPTGVTDIVVGITKFATLIGGGAGAAAMTNHHDNHHDGHQHVDVGTNHIHEHSDLGNMSDHSDVVHQLSDVIHHFFS
ncbi:MAG: hypothetical protein VKL59_12105 [Nostocaceae cyanobacterium]|nr:hypothetical protein [Nostocaceae cyanobacterium]